MNERVTPLRVYRISAGLSQAELAEKAGITRPALSNIERGATKRPLTLTEAALAAALGVERTALFPPGEGSG